MYTVPHHFVYCPPPFCILPLTVMYTVPHHFVYGPHHYVYCPSPCCTRCCLASSLPCLSRVHTTSSSLRLSATSAKTPSAPLTLLTPQTLLLILPFLSLVYSLRTSVALSQQHPTISRSNRFVCQLTEATSLVALSFYTRVCVSLAYQSILFYIYIFISQLSSILILYSVLGTRSFHL